MQNASYYFMSNKLNQVQCNFLVTEQKYKAAMLFENSHGSEFLAIFFIKNVHKNLMSEGIAIIKST